MCWELSSIIFIIRLCDEKAGEGICQTPSILPSGFPLWPWKMSWPSWSSVSSLVRGSSPLSHQTCKGAVCGDTVEMHHLTQTLRCFYFSLFYCPQTLVLPIFLPAGTLLLCSCFLLLTRHIWPSVLRNFISPELCICLLNKPHITNNVIFPGILDVSWLVSPLSWHFTLSQALSSKELQTVSEHVYTGQWLNGTWGASDF